MSEQNTFNKPWQGDERDKEQNLGESGLLTKEIEGLGELIDVDTLLEDNRAKEASRIQEALEEEQGFFETGAQYLGVESSIAGAREFAERHKTRVEYLKDNTEDEIFDLSNEATYQAYTRDGVDPSVYLNAATIEEANLIRRIELERMRVRQEAAKKGGLATFAYEMADPLHIAVGLTSAGVGSAIKATSTLGKVSSFYGLSLAEELGTEYALSKLRSGYEADYGSAFLFGLGVGSVVHGLDTVAGGSVKAQKVRLAKQQTYVNQVRDEVLNTLDPQAQINIIEQAKFADTYEVKPYQSQTFPENYNTDFGFNETVLANKRELEQQLYYSYKQVADESFRAIKQSEEKIKQLTQELNKYTTDNIITELNLDTPNILSKGELKEVNNTLKQLRFNLDNKKYNIPESGKISKRRLKKQAENNLKSDIKQLEDILNADGIGRQSRKVIEGYKKTGKLPNNMETERLSNIKNIEENILKERNNLNKLNEDYTASYNYVRNFKTDVDLIDEYIDSSLNSAIDAVRASNDQNLVKLQKVTVGEIKSLKDAKVSKLSEQIRIANDSLEKIDIELEKLKRVWGKACQI